MNASEKRILKLAITLFIIGLVVRYLPWGLPSIEEFEVGKSIIVANTDTLSVSTPTDSAIGGGGGKTPFESPQLDSQGEKSFEFHRPPKIKVKFPLNINTASMEELCALKGVGPKLAEKIIERRNAAGPFKNASDLKKVHGIGKKKLENMIQLIIFD